MEAVSLSHLPLLPPPSALTELPSSRLRLTADSSVGYFVDPTVIVTKDPQSVTMVNEIFGPVLTVFVYEDDDFEKTCELIDNTTDYALTGSV